MILRRIKRVVGVLAVLFLVSACAPTAGSENANFVDQVYAVTHQEKQEFAAEAKSRDLAVMEWANEEGISTVSSLDELLQMYPEAESPGSGQSDGIRTWNAYSRYVDDLESQLKENIRQHVSLDDARGYYNQNRAQFERQDQVKALVIPWEKGRATDPFELEIDGSNVKALEEHYGELIAMVNQMGEGERQVFNLPDGQTYEVEVLSKTDGGLYPFEDVVQAATFQLVDQRFEEELAKRLT